MTVFVKQPLASPGLLVIHVIKGFSLSIYKSQCLYLSLFVYMPPTLPGESQKLNLIAPCILYFIIIIFYLLGSIVAMSSAEL